MSTSLSPLAAILRDEIEQSSSIPFARFMELALYHPEFGYYRRPVNPFGTSGDFYTAEQLDPFGDMVASFIDKNFTTEPAILELGAGRRDLQAAFARWRYQGFDWDGEALPSSWQGLVFANEFFDALPVRIYRRLSHGWLERRVAFSANRFHWLEVEAATNENLAPYEQHVPEGSVLEVSPRLSEWLTRISDLLKDGLLLVVDYAYSTQELLRFPAGTLLSYRKHATAADVLATPGEQDITAHVHWTELLRRSQEAGLALHYEGTLRSWALSLWTQEELEERWRANDFRWQMQWKQLVVGMGETFRIAVFKKQNASENRRRL